MPGYKRQSSKSYYPKPTKVAKRARSSTSFSKYKNVGYAKEEMASKAEVKFFDTVFPAAGIPAGPASLIDSSIVAEIVNGTGPQARIGRKIRVVKVDYSYTITCNGVSLAGATDAIRYDIWLDRQCNGVAPVPADIYTAVAVNGTDQMPNLFNEKRFKRLYSKVFQFNSQNAIGAANACTNIGLKVEGSFRPNLVIEYDGTAGVINDLTSNNIFQSWSSDGGTCVTTSNLVRVHYTDA